MKTCDCPDGKLNCLTRKELAKYGSTVLSVQKRHVWKEKHPARFIPELPERFINLFSHKGETVLDPFCGSGTTNVVAKQLGRNSIGIDINEYSIRMADDRLGDPDGITTHRLIQADARKLEGLIDDNSVDLIVTSPPYFDMADYKNDDPAQLGNEHDYYKFVYNMFDAFDEMHRVLKHGGYCVINTQDVYKAKVKCSMHIDYVNHMRVSGWELINIGVYILNYSTGGRLAFGYPKSYYPKNDHEYILIFKKTHDVVKINMG